MYQEEVCGLCGRTYSLKTVNRRPCSDNLRLFLLNRKSVKLHEYDICPHCAIKLHNFINDIRRNRPKKCEFCEFDIGPRVAMPSECAECRNFNNFQLKKRMHPRQAYEWEKYKRYLCGEGEQ